MNNEIVAQTGEEPRYDLAICRDPEAVLNEAKKAAKALQDVIAKKDKPVVFNGQQYLEFEDWQTVGRFYGITAKIVSTEIVEIGEVRGFMAKAEAIEIRSGMVVSAADSMCMSDEANWSKKPLFQLRSMAQTRACAKALRNVLAWVVVLAGYKPTPAEEMTAETAAAPVAPPQRKSQATNGGDPRTMLWQECLSLANGNEAEARKVLKGLTRFETPDGKVVEGKTDVAQLSEKWAGATLTKIKKQNAAPVDPEDEVPFGE